nr:hypothetical protein [Paenibacillus xylanexedens]
MSDRDIVYEILKIIQSGKEPKKEDIGADKESFHEWMEQIHDDKLVENISFSRGGSVNKILIVFANGAKLTKAGRDYIELKEEGKI